jgi:hypothetical protein
MLKVDYRDVWMDGQSAATAQHRSPPATATTFNSPGWRPPPPSFFTLFLGACLSMAGDNGVFYQRMNVMFMDQKEILRGLLGNCFRFNFALTSQKGDHFFVDCLVTVSDSIFT